MGISRLLANQALGLFPLTRFYGLKARLLRVAGMDIATDAMIVSSVRIWGDIDLHVGRETFIGNQVLITGGRSSVHIGDFVDISARVTIITGSHEIDMVGNRSAGRGFSRDVKICNGVWIGACCTILGGVTIGEKAIIAAGSTVTSDIPPRTVAAGVPCRPRKTWDAASQTWIVLPKETAR